MSLTGVVARPLSRVWYLQNATGPGLDGLHPYNSTLAITNHPLDPTKPTLVLIPMSGASSSIFCAQVASYETPLLFLADLSTHQFRDPRLKHLNLLSLDARMIGRTVET